MPRQLDRETEWRLRKRSGGTARSVAISTGGGGSSAPPSNPPATIVTGASNFVLNNNAGLSIEPGLIYGRDSLGVIQLAEAATPIRPLYVAAGPADTEARFPVTTAGEVELTLENPAAAFIPGDPIWLSAVTGGGVTGARPAAGYLIGLAADSEATSGKLLVEVRISTQGMN